MDEYHISNLPERFLMTQHYQSSMDQPNLDNVEAKLEAARQRNHQLAMKYFRTKYGSVDAYEQFAKHHNMGERINRMPPNNQQALRLHLQRKAKQIQKQIYNQQQFQEEQIRDVPQPQWIKKNQNRKRPTSNNPWVKVSKPNEQKAKRSDVQGSRYTDSATAPKGKQSQFISQFRNYLQKKDRKQEEPKLQHNQSMNMNRSVQSKFQVSKITNKSIIHEENSESKKKKCYQEQLAKKIFKDIGGECKDDSKVEKLELIQYITANKKILKVLGLTESQLNNTLMKDYITKSDNQITTQQFVFFLLKAVGKEKQINEIKQEKRQKKIPEGCMLSKEIIHHFEKVFKQIDAHTDLIIKRLHYIDRLANDPLIKNYLNCPAVYENEMKKTITLRRIFERIQMECLFGSQDQQKAKEYISWNQFLDYFKSGYSPQSIYNIVLLIDSLHKSEMMGLVQVPEVVINIISESVQKTTSKSGIFNALSLIEAIYRHPDFQDEKYTQVRQQSKIANLPSETFDEVLQRIKKSGQKFITIKQFLEYFSNRGRPIQQFQQAKLTQEKKNFSGVKVKFLGDQITKKNQNLDGYDSDPQMYQSKVMNKNSPRKSGRSVKKLQHSKSILQQSKSKPTTHRRQYKITVPLPFSFEERQKQRLKQKQDRMKEQSVQFQHFRAKPIPEKVLQEGLYQKLLEQDRKRIEQRKKSCMIMTLANQQPFSFLKRKTNKKNKQQREQFVFQARPIPWYCSVDLLEKKKEAQILRNEKIAKEAQQNLAKAKLPPRMERDFQQKQAKEALAMFQKAKRPDSKQKLYKDPPDFEKLHRQFEDGMQRKRKQNKTTVPQQFNFANRTQSRPKTVYKKTEAQLLNENGAKSKGMQDFKRILDAKPAAASTAKFDQQVEKRRKQMQKKRKQEEEKKLQDEKRKKIDEELKIKVQIAAKNKQNNEKEQKEHRDSEMKDQMKNFQSWKKSCVQKGRQQPMLIQRPLKRDQKIQRMKKLYQISQTLKGNGIKGKDHDAYFKRQELLLLQDWQVLKDKL